MSDRGMACRAPATLFFSTKGAWNEKKRTLFYPDCIVCRINHCQCIPIKERQKYPSKKKTEETKPVEISTYTPQLHWQANAKQMYELSIDTRLDFSFTDDSHSTLIQKIEGILNFRVFTTNRNGVGVGFQLSPINYIASARKQPQVEKALSSFFTARFDKNGKLEKLFFPGTLFEQENAVLSEIIRALQVVIPNAGNGTWRLEEEHQTGIYQAEYMVNESQKDLTKVKSRYSSSKIEGYEVQVIKSHYTIKPSEKESWLKSMRGSETLNIHNKNYTLMRSNMNLSLELTVFKPDPNLEIWKEKKDFNAITAAFQKENKKNLASRKEAELKKQRDTFEKKGVELDKIIAQLGTHKYDKKHELVNYLNAFPQEALKIPSLLLYGGIDSNIAAIIINALELSGTSEAQKVLASIMNGLIQTSMNNIRAIIALGGVAEPIQTTLDSLWLCVETRGDDLLDDKSNTALLALGVLGNTLRKNGGEEYSILADKLRSKLDESANNFDMTTTTLLAIGNTGDPSFVPNIEPYLSSENPSLRATSAKALRNMDDRESLSLLAHTLQKEKDSRVRLSLVKSMGNRKADEQSISTVRELVTKEKHKDVRYNMIRYLVNNMHMFPENKEVLEKLLKQKDDEDSLKLILEGLDRQNKSSS